MITVDCIDAMGSDISVVNAARVSFAKEVKEMSDKDVSLIRYLAKNKHRSPFNHCFLSFRVKAPIFVARQLVKHEYLPFNEVSRRYVDSEPELYTPDRWRLAAENVKQGSSDKAMEINKAFKHLEHTNKNAKRNPCTAKFSNWKGRAKREEKEFTVTIDDIPWVDICPILGIPLDYTLCTGEGIKKSSPTLDRIDNTKGYIPGNVMVISSLANTMKSCASPEELILFSKSMLLQYAGEFTSSTNSVESFHNEIKDLYKRLISAGMCAEQARMVLPLNTMTEWIWSGSLGAFMKMVNLRDHDHAQYETRLVAKLVGEHIASEFPESYKALREFPNV